MASKSAMMPINTFSTAAFAAIDPFPPHVRRKFKYAELVSLATGTAGVFGSEYRFNLNALYDPDYTSAGHQPYGFDQLNTIYGKYRVDKCTWRITFTTPGGTNDILCALSVSPGTSASLTSLGAPVALEKPNVVHGLLSSAGKRSVVLNGSLNLSLLVGVSKAKYEAEDNYSAAISANPSQLALLSIAVASYSGSASEAASVMVELEYDAYLYSRLIQSQS